MKSLLSFFLFCGLSLNSLAQDAEIRFTIENAPSDSCVIAFYCFDLVNSCYLSREDQGKSELQVGHLNKKGEVRFKIPETKKGLFQVVFFPLDNPRNRSIRFIFDGNSFNMSFDFLGVYNSIQTDSKTNQLRNQEISHRENYEADLSRVKSAYTYGPTLYFDEGTDVERFEDSVRKANEDFYTNLYKNYPTNLAVQMLKAEEGAKIPEELINTNEYDDYYFLHCFDNLDFSQSWLITMLSVDEQIESYFYRLVDHESHPDAIIAAWDKVIAATSGNKEMYRLLVNKGFDWSIRQMGKMWSVEEKFPSRDAVTLHFMEKYYLSGKADWIDDNVLEAMKNFANILRHSVVGKQVVNFELHRSDDAKYDLNNIESDYTILLFVGTNCESCSNRIEKELLEVEASIPSDVNIHEVIYTTDLRLARAKKQEKDVFWNVAVMGRADELNQAMNDYELSVLPKVFVLDKNKVIIGKQVGKQLNIEEALEIISVDKLKKSR